MRPTIGRTVLYVLTSYDVARINAMPNSNPHYEGQELPLIVARVWTDEYGAGIDGVNGQVILDGMGTLWVTSIREGDSIGTWHWPKRD